MYLVTMSLYSTDGILLRIFGSAAFELFKKYWTKYKLSSKSVRRHVILYVVYQMQLWHLVLYRFLSAD
jgi:hypothetical protein